MKRERGTASALLGEMSVVAVMLIRRLLASSVSKPKYPYGLRAARSVSHKEEIWAKGVQSLSFGFETGYW